MSKVRNGHGKETEIKNAQRGAIHNSPCLIRNDINFNDCNNSFNNFSWNTEMGRRSLWLASSCQPHCYSQSHKWQVAQMSDYHLLKKNHISWSYCTNIALGTAHCLRRISYRRRFGSFICFHLHVLVVIILKDLSDNYFIFVIMGRDGITITNSVTYNKWPSGTNFSYGISY